MCVITEAITIQPHVGWGGEYASIFTHMSVRPGNTAKTGQRRPSWTKIVVKFMVLFVVFSVHLSFVGSSLVGKWQREGQGN